MSISYENLAEAFAGESQAHAKYLAYAKKADAEGYPQVARLFRAAAAAEAVHAQNHFRAMNEIKTTAENLRAAIDGEHFEVVTMYPPYMEAAQSAQENRALKTFTWAWEVEKEHEALYQEALDCLNVTPDSYDYYICPFCGHTHPRNAPDTCPVCGAPGSKFEKIS